MIFEVLWEAAKNNELILIDGGMCHFHLRKDGQLTIREIITTCKNQNIGSKMLDILKQIDNVKSIFAKCPSNLNANRWYESQGFKYEGQETTKTGRLLNLWRLYIVDEEIKY